MDCQQAVRTLRALSFIRFGIAILLLVLAGSGVQVLHAQSGDELVKIKSEAQHGNADAQSKLADVYNSSSHFSEAAKWYRAAAEKGIAHAQCQLGKLYLRGAPAMMGGPRIMANPQEGVQWLLRAANQDDLQAEVELGTCFKEGRGVKTDLIEAYKWYTLAAKRDGIWGKMYRDPIILKMPSEQIAEGEKRAAAFRPNAPMASPYLSMVSLKGITGGKDRRMAIINDHSFAVGEESSVKIGTQPLRVKCVEIREKSALIVLLDTGEKAVLSLK